MVYLESFGLERQEESTEKLLQETLKRPERIFAGYNYAYLYRSYGWAEFVLNVGEVDGKPQVLGGSTHVKGNHIYSMRVEQRVADGDQEAIYVCSSLSGHGATIAVNTVMGDCVPPLQPGDTLTFQGIGFLHGDYLLTISNDKAIRKFAEDYIPDDGQILSGAPHQSLFNMIYAKVRRYRAIPFKDGRVIHALEVMSYIGPLTLIVPPAFLEDKKGIKRALEKASDVYVTGTFYLSGDVAVNKYSSGAITDTEHLLRLLRASFVDGNTERLKKYVAEGSVCETSKGKTGILPFVEAFHKTFSETRLAWRDKAPLLMLSLKDNKQVLSIEAENEEIKRITFLSPGRYELLMEEKPESAEERFYRTHTFYSDTVDGWYRILAGWASNDLSNSLKVFYGLDEDSSGRIGDESFQGREDLYNALHDHIDKISLAGVIRTADDMRSEITLRLGPRGTIKRLDII